MMSNKENRTVIIQVRLTPKEKKRVEANISKTGMKKSDYFRDRLLRVEKKQYENVQLTVAVQEILNYIEENYSFEDKTLERKVDGIWKMLQ